MMDEMTSRERIDAAIALQPVDRVPVVPIMSIFSPRFQGVKMARVVQDPAAGLDALIRTFDDLGGWDATYLAAELVTDLGFAFVGMRTKLPGKELGEDELWQLDEQEIMKAEDYDFIAQHGWNAYLGKCFPLLQTGIPIEEFPARLAQLGAWEVHAIQAWEAKGVPVFSGIGCNPPFETLAFTRSLKEIMVDAFRRPDKMIAAMDAYMAEQVPQTVGTFAGVRQATKWGYRVAFIGSTRAPFLAPRKFDVLYWPYLEKVVNGLLEGGVTPMLHFDSNWDNYLEYFLRLPTGQVILELDSATNIFKAKEILKGHRCIMGDVPPSMLTLGTPEEVTDYCKKLIDVVGEGSGFILSTGCDCPINAKPENVRAMIETGKSYYPHHKLFSAAVPA